MISIIYLSIAFLLILLNAFFVAAEFAMVRLRKTQIETLLKNSGIQGKILTKIHERLDSYLSACQVGVTLASLGLGWVGEPAFAHLFQPLLAKLGVSPLEIKVIAFTLAFGTISFLHIVVGELMPKSLAIRQPEKLSIWTALPLYCFYWLTYPAIMLLNIASNSLLRLFRLNTSSNDQHFYSTEEIKLVLNSSFVHGEITKDEADIIEHTLEFADLRITEVMRQADELVTLDINTSLDAAIKLVLATRFSRYPVCDKLKIIGFVHVKDIFAASFNNKPTFNITELLRPTLNVQYNIPAINLLRNFRQAGTHFSLIYRGTNLIGFVTLDNLLHIILGRMKDEFHKTENDWVKNPDGSISVPGDCSIYSLEQALDCEIEDNEKFAIDNLTELILHRLGHLPDKNKIVDLHDFSFKITVIKNSIIEEVIIFPKT